MVPWPFKPFTRKRSKIHVLAFGSHAQHTNDFIRSLDGGSANKKSSLGNEHEMKIGDYNIVLIEPTEDLREYSNIKRYKKLLGKGSRAVSAIYLQPSIDHNPSFDSQHSIRILAHLNSTGLFYQFFILPLSSDTPNTFSSTELLDSSVFQASMDFDLWKGYLPPSDCNHFEDLVRILSNPRSTPKKARPRDAQPADALRSLERKFFNDIQRYMSEREARVREEVQKSIPQPILEKTPSPPEAPRLEQSVQAVEVEPPPSVEPPKQQSMVQDTSRIRELEGEKLAAEHTINALKRAMADDAKVHKSLLASLNIHDNHDVSSIKRGFEILNDRISDFASEIVEQLMNHAESLLDDVNALKCHDSSGLFQQLGVSHDSPSLLRSHSGKVLPAGLFVDLAVGSIICRTIHEEIFSPFYPLLQSDHSTDEDDRSKFLSEIYQTIRKRDPQMQSAKWRVDTYSTLVKLHSEDRGLSQRIQTEVGSRIDAIIVCLIGKTVPLDNELKGLDDIIQKALRLNNTIKTEVLRVGDFHTMCFVAGEPFDEQRMSILDERVGENPPSEILSTCGLGLLLTQAVGGNQEPKTEVIMKAKVVSESVF